MKASEAGSIAYRNARKYKELIKSKANGLA